MKRRCLSLIIAGLVTLGLAAPIAAGEPSVAIDRFGAYAVDGYGVVYGTVACSHGPWAATVNVRLQQKQGNAHVDGWGTGVIECTGGEQSWMVGGIRSMEVDRFGRYLYRAGPASVTLVIPAGDGDELLTASIVIRGPAL